MGILGKFIAKSAIKSVARKVGYRVADIGIKVCDKAIERLEKGNVNENKAFLDGAKDGHSRLIVGQKPYTFKESFQIFDEDENVKYIVKGKLISATHDFTVYDATGKIALGRVREKMLALRSPISFERHPKDFIIQMDGKKLGKMKSRYVFGKQKCEFTFNNWVLEGNVFGVKYKVLDGKEKVMEVSQKVWVIGDTYYLDIANPDDELLCVLILLAIDSSHSSKSDDNKQTVIHKYRRARRTFRRLF